jgi:hypothetical protein
MSDWGFDPASLFPDLDEFEGQPFESTDEELKIEDIELHPMPDGQRVMVGIRLTSARRRPNVEVAVLKPGGAVVAELLIVEARSARQIVTLHLRPPDPTLTYTLKAGLIRENELIDVYETELRWL